MIGNCASGKEVSLTGDCNTYGSKSVKSSLYLNLPDASNISVEGKETMHFTLT